ncbi:MAG: hypothetical protein AAB091_04005, partial [Elusimicrobiota bacterium]
MVLINYLDEARRYVERYGTKGNIQCHVVIALSPRAREFLEGHGIACVDSLSYFDNEAHIRASLKSKEMLSRLRDRIGFDKLSGMEAAFVNVLFWNLKSILNHCLWASEVLHNALQRHHPQALIVFRNKLKEWHNPLVAQRNSYVHKVAASMQKGRIVSLEILPVHDAVGARERRWIRLRKLLWRMAGFLFGHFHLLLLRRDSADKPVLVTTTAYRMNFLSKSILEQTGGVRPFLLTFSLRHWRLLMPSFWRSAGLFGGGASLDLVEGIASENGEGRRRLHRSIMELAGVSEREKEVFSYHGAFIGSILAGKLYGSLGSHILGLHRKAAALERILMSLKPRAIFSAGDREDDAITGAVSLKLGIPSMIVSHGSHTPPKDQVERIEWGEHRVQLIGAPYRFIAVQSPLAEEFLKTFPSVGKPVRTGPLMWGAAIDRQKRDYWRSKFFKNRSVKHVFMHVGSPKAFHVPRFHIYETSDECLASTADLVRAVRELDNAGLVLRFRGSEEMGVSSAASLIRP